MIDADGHSHVLGRTDREHATAMTVDTMPAKPDQDTDLDAAAADLDTRSPHAGADADGGAAGAAGADGSAAAGADDEPEKPRRGRPKGSGARRTRTVELTLTVSGTADGDWQAELKHGNTWVARGLPIAAAAVSRAAKELHEDLSAPIDEVIHAARGQQQAKVAALEAELEQARQALAELAD